MIIVLYVLAGIAALVFLFVFLKFFGLWFRALLSGAPVEPGATGGHVDPPGAARAIVDSRIMLTKAGMDIDSDQLETHYLAGGNVLRVVKALIAANRANIPLDFKQGHGHRPGRPRRARRRADQRQPQGHRLPQPGPAAGPPSTRWPRTASSSRPRPA